MRTFSFVGVLCADAGEDGARAKYYFCFVARDLRLWDLINKFFAYFDGCMEYVFVI